jgi:Outer membrane protein beta-barrel domain
MKQINNFLRTAVTIFLLAVSAILDAQIKSGYIFGLNLTTVSITTSHTLSNPGMPLGVHFGMDYSMPLNKKFSLLCGFLFSSKGSDYKIDSVDISLTPTYLEIPLNINCTFGSKATKILLFAGPYCACTIGGYQIISGREFRYLKFGSDETKDLKFFDFGFNFGTGVSFKNIMISAQYGIGLTDVSPARDIAMRNKVIGISVSSLKPVK